MRRRKAPDPGAAAHRTDAADAAGHPEAASFDYIRHGTTTLFAALKVATGKVTEACTQRHRHQEFLVFLRQVAASYPRRELHVVVDNRSTHKHPVVRAWLARHPRVHRHFTPTSGSWLNLVEAFFSIISRQALRRGSFPTVANLIAAIERFIAAWNDPLRPVHLDQGPGHRHRQGHPLTQPQDTATSDTDG